MAFCIQCRKQIAEEDYYCNHCGYVNTIKSTQLDSQGGLTNKLWTTTDRTLKKGLEVSIKTSELLDLSKKREVRDAVRPETDPLKIAKVRYARGEVPQLEYEEMKKELQVVS